MKKRKIISFIIHFLVFITLMILAVIFLGELIRPYIASSWIRIVISSLSILSLWLMSLLIFDGCLFTYLENIISKKIWGKELYPGYNRKQTIVYKLFKGIKIRI